MSASFRESLRNYVPPWLLDRPRLGLTAGFRLLYSFGAAADAGAQAMLEGSRARHPGLGTPTALPYLGRGRRIERGPSESAEAFAARLVRYRPSWSIAGNALSILEQLAGFFAPSPPRMRVVNAGGMWTTREPDGTITRHRATPNNWLWDGRADLWSRIWIIVYASGGAPCSDGGTWGGGMRRWGDGGTWGTGFKPNAIATLKQIARTWSSAATVCPYIIVAFDPSSFDPLSAPGAAGMPDGTWGSWSKTVGGVQVPARLTTARYIEVGA